MPIDDAIHCLDAAVSEFFGGMPDRFVPHASYSLACDALYIYMADVATFANRVDQHLTVLVPVCSPTDVAGYIVHGVSDLVSGFSRSGRVTVKPAEGVCPSQASRLAHALHQGLGSFTGRVVCAY
jgi:hypothetical protein